jgi:prepilin-type N-terminal cleavage/methylation domain-containing protein
MLTHIQPGRGKRGAFTLIELLVVIAIIAILVSLTAAGVMKLLSKGPKVKVTSEISQFDIAIQTALGEFGVDYIPSYIVLREDNEYNLSNPAELKTVTYLKRIFSKNLNLTPVSKGGTGIDWNGNGQIDPSTKTGPFILEGQHCLVFFLGGIPTPPGSPNGTLGFSTSQQNPATVGGTRRGPFYAQFESSRLVRNPATGFFAYLDAWTSSNGAQPYAYFSAYGVNNGYTNSWGLLNGAASDCPSLGFTFNPLLAVTGGAYYQAAGTLKNYNNPRTHQIISAGQDQMFGAGGAWVAAAGTMQSPAEKDNQTNFARLVLGAGGQ